MSETTATTASEPTQKPPLRSNIEVHPGDVLLHLIVTLLSPMFFGVCGGNLDFARMAALETVNAYRARGPVDLIAVAQIIAFGLASVSSACLSMTDDISLTMTLKLRANANACDRSAERNRRALEKNRLSPLPDPVFAPDPGLEPRADPEADRPEADRPEADRREADRKDAEAIARAAAVCHRAEALQARAGVADPAPIAAPAAAAVPAAAPATTPDPAAPATPDPAAPAAADPATPDPATPEASAAPAAAAPVQAAPAAIPDPTAAPDTELTEREIQRMWGAAMTVVANEHAAALANLPAEEREAARARTRALRRAARDLMSGDVPPRPRPGELGTPLPPTGF